jgi:hypothetical protein
MSSSIDSEIMYRSLAFDAAPHDPLGFASSFCNTAARAKGEFSESIECHVSAAPAFVAQPASRAPPRPVYLSPSHVESCLDAESLRSHVLACIRTLDLDIDTVHNGAVTPATNPFAFHVVKYHEFAAVHVALSIFAASSATSLSSPAHIVEIRLLRTCDGFAFSRIRDAIFSCLFAAGATCTAKPASNAHWAERNRAWKSVSATQFSSSRHSVASADYVPLSLSPAEAFWQAPTLAALPVAQPVSASPICTPFPPMTDATLSEPQLTATDATSDMAAAVTSLLRQASSEFNDVRAEAFRTLAIATCTCTGAELSTPTTADSNAQQVTAAIASAGDSAASCLLTALTSTHNLDLCRCAAATISNLVRAQSGIADAIARLGGAEILAQLIIDGVGSRVSADAIGTLGMPRSNVQMLREVARALIHLHTQLFISGSHSLAADAHRHTAVAEALVSHSDSVLRTCGVQFRAMILSV